MTAEIGNRIRRPAPRSKESATHKFPIGAHVTHKVGARSQSLWFRVTRHLPNGGDGLQYRIKDDRDGHERVVTEAALEWNA